MKFLFTEKARKDYEALTARLQALVDKQLEALLRDIRYPSLKAKKYHESEVVWQARVNRDYRFYFRIAGDTYVILTIIKRPK